MKIYQYTDNEFTQEVNNVKDLLARDLYDAGVISKEQCVQIQQDFAVILSPAKMLGGKVKESLGWEDDKTYFKTIKLNLNNNKDKEDVHQSEDSDREGVDNGSS